MELVIVNKPIYNSDEEFLKQNAVFFLIENFIKDLKRHCTCFLASVYGRRI